MICDELHQMELLFGIILQKKFFLSYAWETENKMLHTKWGRFLTYTRKCEQKANVAVVNQPLRNHPDTVVLYLSTSKGDVIKGPTAYFISDQDSKKREKTPTYISLVEFTAYKKKNIC